MTANDLRTRYTAAVRQLGLLKSSVYDVSNRCNLTCDGCLFFSDEDRSHMRPQADLDTWRLHLSAERARGINYIYLGGAEPSLRPVVLAICYDFISKGLVFTNGIKKIDPAIRYRLHVSIWGNDMHENAVRGATSFKKALRNYQGDPRAIFVMTLNRENLDQINAVAQSCADHGVKMTFSLFSPTREHNKLHAQNAMRRAFFNHSEEHDLRLRGDSLVATERAMLDAIRDWPETIRMPVSFAKWLTGEGPRFRISGDGIATDCLENTNPAFRHFGTDLKQTGRKCGTASIDCSDCRLYAPTLTSHVARNWPRSISELDADWVECLEFVAEILMPVDSFQKQSA